jgi:hypothetical protein
MVLLKTFFYLQIKIFYLKHRADLEKQNSSQQPVVLEMNVIHYKKSNIT